MWLPRCMQAASRSSREDQACRLIRSSILLRLGDLEFGKLRLRKLPDGVGKIRPGLPAERLRQVDVCHQVHRLVGMEWHLSQAKFYIESKLTADRTHDAAQRERQAAADIEHIA